MLLARHAHRRATDAPAPSTVALALTTGTLLGITLGADLIRAATWVLAVWLAALDALP